MKTGFPVQGNDLLPQALSVMPVTLKNLYPLPLAFFLFSPSKIIMKSIFHECIIKKYPSVKGTFRLYFAMLGKGIIRIAGRDNNMVQNINVEEGKALHHITGEIPVRLAGRGITRRVIMRQNQASGIMYERLAGNNSGMNFHRRQTAAEHLLCRNQPVLGIKKQHHKMFPVMVAEL